MVEVLLAVCETLYTSTNVYELDFTQRGPKLHLNSTAFSSMVRYSLSDQERSEGVKTVFLSRFVKVK